MQELWKDIKGYEDLYQVSNYGRVKSKDRIQYFNNRFKDCQRLLKGRILSPSMKPYPHITLCKNDKHKDVRVHQLVWDAFGEIKKPKDMVIDHIDNDKTNNIISNLQLLNHRDNIIKDLDIGQYPLGVSYDNRKGKYQARISLNGKRLHLGLFNSPEEASNSYQEKIREIKYAIST